MKQPLLLFSLLFILNFAFGQDEEEYRYSGTSEQTRQYPYYWPAIINPLVTSTSKDANPLDISASSDFTRDLQYLPQGWVMNFQMPNFFQGNEREIVVYYPGLGTTGPPITLHNLPPAKIFDRYWRERTGWFNHQYYMYQYYATFYYKSGTGGTEEQSVTYTPSTNQQLNYTVINKPIRTFHTRNSRDGFWTSRLPPTSGNNYVRTEAVKDGGIPIAQEVYSFSIRSVMASFINLPETDLITFCTGDGLLDLYDHFSDKDGVTFTINNDVGTIQTGNIIDKSTFMPGMFKIVATKQYDNGLYTKEIDLKVTPVPVASITKSISGNTFCQGTQVTLSAPEAPEGETYTYEWSTGQTSREITVTNSITASVTVSNGGCESTSETITLTATPLPQANITVQTGGNRICEGQTAVLSATAGEGLTYQWLDEDDNVVGTSQIFSTTGTGSFRVRVTNQNGCSNTSMPTTIIVQPNPTPEILANGPIEFCEGGSVILTASMPDGSTPNLTWSSGQNTQSITVTESGIYSVRANNANGCVAESETIEVVVKPNPKPDIFVSGELTFCEGNTVTLTSSPGASYLWSNGETTRSITTDNPGQYTVTVTNNNGCERISDPVTVIVLPNQKPEIAALSSTDICEGETVTLQVTNAQADVTYTWSNGVVGIENTVSTVGSYYVIASNNRCSQSSEPIEVTVTPIQKPQVTASGSLEFCQGETVTLTVTNEAGADEIRWSNGETGNQIEVSASGTYIAYIVKGDCERASDPVTVSVLPNVKPSIQPLGVTTFCEGDQVAIAINNPQPGVTYTWNDGSQGYQIIAETTGQYYVIATNENGCASVSEAISVTVNPIPKPTITAGGDVDLCEGESVTLTVNETAASYRWSNGETTRSITITTPGIYTAYISNDEGCERPSDPVTVSVRENRPVSISMFGQTEFCEGDSVVLTVNQEGEYLWSTGETTRSITVKTSALVNVRVINGEGCESVSDNISINVKPIPKPTVTANGQLEFCQGDSVTLRIEQEAPSYRWSNGSTAREITVSSSQVLTAYITNDEGCERASNPVQVTVKPNPIPKINVSGPTAFCEGDSVTLSITPIAGYTYTWSNGDTGHTTTVKSSSGVYVSSATPDGCIAISEVVDITVYPLPIPTVTASSPLEFCEGDSVTLTIDQIAYGYRWSNGATTRSITVHTSQTLTAFVTNEQGCIRESEPVSVRVTPIAKPTITVIGQTTICDGDTVILSSSPGVEYLWSDGSTTREIRVTDPGNYSVTVTNAAGCQRTSDDVAIAVIPNDVPTISSTLGTQFCEGEETILTASEGQLYRWNTGETTREIRVSTSGVYTVTVVNENNCSRMSLPFEVTVNSPTALQRIPDQQICINGEDLLLDEINTNPLNGEYTGEGVVYNRFDPSQAGIGHHTIVYNYVNEHGCASTTSFTIEVAALTELNVGADTTVCVNDADILLMIDGLPVGTKITGNGVQGSRFVPSEAGVGVHEITYTYGNAENCITVETRVIRVAPVPTAPVISGNTATCDNSTIELRAYSTVLGNANITYRWYRENESEPFSEGATLRHVMKGTETFYVTAQSGGCESERTPVQVFSLTPDVRLTASATEIMQGTPITFSLDDVANSNPSVRWEWNFGDGFTSDERNPKHYYNKPGVYDVSVRVFSDEGCMAELKEERLITVQEDPVVIDPPIMPDTPIVDDTPFEKTVVYPNPIRSGQAQIRAYNESNTPVNAVLEIYTITGKLISKQDITMNTGQNDIAIENLNRLVARTYYLFVLKREDRKEHETIKVLML